MKIALHNQAIIDGYWESLKSLSDEVKLKLIEKIIKSFSEKSRSNTKKESEHTDEMIKRFAGSWAGNESTDEIMDSIKKNSTLRKIQKL